MSSVPQTVTESVQNVSSSGDKLIKDLNFRNLHMVSDFNTGEQMSTISSCFVYDPSTTSENEVTRITHTITGTKESGSIDVNVFDSASSEMVNVISSNATATDINSGEISSSFNSDGLSFNSDDCSIFFGESKTFRMKFISGSVPRLVFQYLDTESGEYVTKSSIL